MWDDPERPRIGCPAAEHLAGERVRCPGCRGRLQPRRAALRRDPVVRADDARALPDAAERARRLREIALSAVIAGVAVVCVRRLLEADGIQLEPRIALSVAAGAAFYVSSLALIAPAVARRLLGWFVVWGRRCGRRADQAEGTSAVDAPPGCTCRRSASRRRRAPSWPMTNRPVMGSSPRRRSRRISLARALKIVS